MNTPTVSKKQFITELFIPRQSHIRMTNSSFDWLARRLYSGLNIPSRGITVFDEYSSYPTKEQIKEKIVKHLELDDRKVKLPPDYDKFVKHQMKQKPKYIPPKVNYGKPKNPPEPKRTLPELMQLQYENSRKAARQPENDKLWVEYEDYVEAKELADHIKLQSQSELFIIDSMPSFLPGGGSLQHPSKRAVFPIRGRVI